MWAPNSPAKRYPCTPCVVISDGACSAQRLSWVRTALALRSPSDSPYAAFEKMSEHVSELTPGLVDMAAASYQSLLAPVPMSRLLTEPDAKRLLEHVVEKVTTRAEKRKHEAAITRSAELEAAAEQEARKVLRGAARAAKRAAIASRPVKEVFARDNCGRRV